MTLRVRRARRRLAWAVAVAIVVAAGALGSCTTSGVAIDATVADGAVDGAGADATTTATDAADEAIVVPPSEAGAPEAGGHCSPIQGPACDVVLQNCPKGLECVPQIVGTRLTTACVTAGTGNKPAGSTCCPGQENQCVAGLECFGSPCIDGGPELGRCTPRCCPGDDLRCGASIPEGVKGTCDLEIVALIKDASVSLYRVCSYKPVCKPFQVQPCPDRTYACLLQSDNNSFRCDELFTPPGKLLGARCDIINDCADGMECLGEADAATGSTCRYTCYRADGGVPPFGTSELTDAEGSGGCPSGTRCTGDITDAPRWYGFCQ